jgi:hypothetical protein
MATGVAQRELRSIRRAARSRPSDPRTPERVPAGAAQRFHKRAGRRPAGVKAVLPSVDTGVSWNRAAFREGRLEEGSDVTYSRRVKRLRAGWDGICRIEGESDDRRCRVVDISMLGLGITLSHPSPSELGGRGISIDVPAVAQLEGEITHAEPILGGAVRAGVTFNDPTTSELNVTASQSSVSDSRET